MLSCSSRSREEPGSWRFFLHSTLTDPWNHKRTCVLGVKWSIWMKWCYELFHICRDLICQEPKESVYFNRWRPRWNRWKTMWATPQVNFCWFNSWFSWQNQVVLTSYIVIEVPLTLPCSTDRINQSHFICIVHIHKSQFVSEALTRWDVLCPEPSMRVKLLKPLTGEEGRNLRDMWGPVSQDGHKWIDVPCNRGHQRDQSIYSFD